MVVTNSHTVIVGAGIIGCATAYFLSQTEQVDPTTIHLVEASPELFASASGKSGGFCVADWFGPATASLGELSFRLHKELASQYDGRQTWGYSVSTGVSLETVEQTDGSRGEDWLYSGATRARAAQSEIAAHSQNAPAWLSLRRGSSYDLIGKEKGVAQVDPLRLSNFLLHQSIAQGVHLHQPASPASIVRDGAGLISAIRIHQGKDDEVEILCTRLLITAGAWTSRVFQQLFPESKLKIPISSLAGHSIVVKSPHWTKAEEAKGCHAVFTTIESGLSPEIFSRIGEEIYVAGLNDAGLTLPEKANDARVDPNCIQQLKDVAKDFINRKGGDPSDVEVVREGLCFRPVTPNGVPILARVADKHIGVQRNDSDLTRGVFVAAGHGPWGISHSVGTGKVMAEMLQGQPTSANVTMLGLR